MWPGKISFAICHQQSLPKCLPINYNYNKQKVSENDTNAKSIWIPDTDLLYNIIIDQYLPLITAHRGSHDLMEIKERNESYYHLVSKKWNVIKYARCVLKMCPRVFKLINNTFDGRRLIWSLNLRRLNIPNFESKKMCLVYC